MSGKSGSNAVKQAGRFMEQFKTTVASYATVNILDGVGRNLKNSSKKDPVNVFNQMSEDLENSGILAKKEIKVDLKQLARQLEDKNELKKQPSEQFFSQQQVDAIVKQKLDDQAKGFQRQTDSILASQMFKIQALQQQLSQMALKVKVAEQKILEIKATPVFQKSRPSARQPKFLQHVSDYNSVEAQARSLSVASPQNPQMTIQQMHQKDLPDREFFETEIDQPRQSEEDVIESSRTDLLVCLQRRFINYAGNDQERRRKATNASVVGLSMRDGSVHSRSQSSNSAFMRSPQNTSQSYQTIQVESRRSQRDEQPKLKDKYFSKTQINTAQNFSLKNVGVELKQQLQQDFDLSEEDLKMIETEIPNEDTQRITQSQGSRQVRESHKKLRSYSRTSTSSNKKHTGDQTEVVPESPRYRSVPDISCNFPQNERILETSECPESERIDPNREVAFSKVVNRARAATVKSLNNFLNPIKCTCHRTTQVTQPQMLDDVENTYLLKGGKKTNIADIKRKHGYPSDVKSDEEDKDNTSAVANESLPLEIQVKKPFSSKRMFNPTPARKTQADIPKEACGDFCKNIDPDKQKQLIQDAAIRLFGKVDFKAGDGKAGKKCFLISEAWWQQWCDYVNYEESEEDANPTEFQMFQNPGSSEAMASQFRDDLLRLKQQSGIIKEETRQSHRALGYKRPELVINAGLLLPDNCLTLKPNLVEFYDFVAVPTDIWKYLYAWYSADWQIQRHLKLDSSSGKSYLELYPFEGLEWRAETMGFQDDEVSNA